MDCRWFGRDRKKRRKDTREAEVEVGSLLKARLGVVVDNQPEESGASLQADGCQGV